MYEGYNILNLASGEFLCPVCRRMANIAIPIVRGDKRDLQVSPVLTISSLEWRARTTTALDVYTLPIDGTFPSASVSSGGDVHAPTSGGNRGISSSSSAGCQGNRQPLILQRMTGELIRDSVLWEHTNGVMRRLTTPSTRADGSEPETFSAPVMQSPSSLHTSLHTLSAAVATTLVSAEIAARSGMWDGCSSSSFRRLLGTLIRQARMRTTNIQSMDMRQRGCRELWHALLEQGDGGRREITQSSRRVDPFVSVLFLIMLWPTKLTDFDVRNIVEVGYQAEIARARSSASDTVLEPVLFLRRASTMVGSLFDIDIPLCCYSDDASIAPTDAIKAEQDALILFLGISALSMTDTMAMTTEKTAKPGKPRTVCVPRRFGLVSLPTLFQDLLEMLDGRNCSSCKQISRTPALCLACSAIVCLEKGSCPGWAKRHAYDCGAGVSVFLALKTTGVCVYRNDRLAMWGSPYLDEHGEEDAELRRGKPLFLSHERYSSLERLWLTHGFDQNARIIAHTVLQ
jgi:Proteolysis_6 C-terminal